MTKQDVLMSEHRALDEALEWMLECESADRVSSFVEGIVIMTERVLSLLDKDGQ